MPEIKITTKEKNDVKFIGKIDKDSYLVELLGETTGYALIINTVTMTKSHLLPVMAWPKWVTIEDMPKDFKTFPVDLDKYTHGSSTTSK